MSQLPLPRYVVDPDHPRAPPQHVWDAMSADERARVVSELPAHPPDEEPIYRAEAAERRAEAAERRIEEERQRAQRAEERAEATQRQAEAMQRRAEAAERELAALRAKGSAKNPRR